MNQAELTGLLDAMAKSLRQQPNQFSFTVGISQIGTNVENSGPGTGLNVSVSGGGAGSSTIGYQSSVSGNTGIRAEITNAEASAEVARQVNVAAASLEAMVIELKRNSPDKSKMSEFLKQFGQTIIPQALVETVKFGLRSFGVAI